MIVGIGSTYLVVRKSVRHDGRSMDVKVLGKIA